MEQTLMTGTEPVQVRKEKRVLDIFKCKDCRRRKVKCSPQSRTWPQKCLECQRLGFDCSQPQRATRRRRNRSSTSEIAFPTALNTPSQPGPDRQEMPTGGTEYQTQDTMVLQPKIPVLKNQLQYQELQNVIAQDLKESRERHEKQEEKIALLATTVHGLERRIRDLSGPMTLIYEE